MQRVMIAVMLGVVLFSTAACETTGPRYRNVRSYSEGLAPAQHGSGKWGFVNEKQEWVIQPKFDDAKEFQAGKAAVRLGNKWGFIDKRGNGCEVLLLSRNRCAGACDGARGLDIPPGWEARPPAGAVGALCPDGSRFAGRPAGLPELSS